MTAPITVCIGTYGRRRTWAVLAERARESAENQTMAPTDIIWVHGDNLRDARNGAAGAARSDWLCFLDADDQLDHRYIEAMTNAIAGHDGPALVQPATVGVYPDGREDAQAVVIPSRPLVEGNFLVIGTLIRRDQFIRIGGFDDWPVFEDWDLWLRAWDDGAQVLTAPAAIYRVHVNLNGRNSCDPAIQYRAYSQIRDRHLRGART
jgi:GT2 family glycosyltransferase